MTEPTAATPPPAPPTGPQSKSTLILVFGIVGLFCCFLAPVAWIMGKKELAQIRAGVLPASEEGKAKVGMILGIIGTALLVINFLWILLGGGLAVLQGLGGG